MHVKIFHALFLAKIHVLKLVTARRFKVEFVCSVLAEYFM